MKGSSTGRPPIQVKQIKDLINNQYKIFSVILNPVDFLLGLKIRGKVYKIKIPENAAITPPNLLGTERRIA